ncbi:hypothetical protein C8Q79DRAFT_748862 [Trametes meyenii]|nr:hypothetical protein C8Q79DRAFT_748862 [Trametes meyenii]
MIMAFLSICSCGIRATYLQHRTRRQALQLAIKMYKISRSGLLIYRFCVFDELSPLTRPVHLPSTSLAGLGALNHYQWDPNRRITNSSTTVSR